MKANQLISPHSTIAYQNDNETPTMFEIDKNGLDTHIISNMTGLCLNQANKYIILD